MMIFSFAAFLAAVLGCVITGQNILWALWLGILLFSLLGLRQGHTVKELAAFAWKKGRTSLVVVPVFFLIGLVTGLWRASGTIAYFLYHGLRAISPPWFILMAFLLSALLSFALGTSFGVVGTAGVVLITMARSGGVDLAITAGAIVSGAYFGDRCSPMSSCASLVATCTGTELYPNVKEMLRTAVLPTLLTTVFFAAFSLQNPITAVDAGILNALAGGFSLHWAVLLPAALMLALPLAKVPVKWAMAASSAVALVLAAAMGFAGGFVGARVGNAGNKVVIQQVERTDSSAASGTAVASSGLLPRTRRKPAHCSYAFAPSFGTLRSCFLAVNFPFSSR